MVFGKTVCVFLGVNFFKGGLFGDFKKFNGDWGEVFGGGFTGVFKRKNSPRLQGSGENFLNV